MTAIVIATTLDESGSTMVGTAIEVSGRVRDGKPESWRRYPLSTVTVSPDFREAARWLTDLGSRTHADGFGLYLPEREAHVLVDVSHKLYGMPLAEVLWGCQARRKWTPMFAAVVEVEADVVVPQRDDRVRTKIGRGTLISALAQATRTGLLRFGRSEQDLLREWDAYNRGTAAGGKEAPPRVQALKLAAWGAMRMHRRLMAERVA